MHDKKFILIARSLSIAEQKRFGVFITSAYFNKNQNLVRLWEFVQRYAPLFDHPKLTDQRAFAVVFGQLPYDPDAITKLLNKLFDLFKTFIAHNGLDEHHTDPTQANANFKEQLRLIDFYSQRLPRYAAAAIAKAEQLRQTLPLRDAAYFHADFELSTLRAAYLSATRDKSDIGLGDALQKSEIYYLVNQLYLACLLVNQGGIANLDTQLLSIDDLLHSVAQHPQYLAIPSLAIWYDCLMLLTQTDKKTPFERIKSHLDALRTSLHPDDIRIVYTLLENNAKKVTATDQAFYAQLFELYDTQLRQNLIKSFPPSLFKNIVVVALRLEQYDWIKDFLARRQHDIVAQYRDAVHQYIDVHLLFKQGQYEAALTALSRADYGIDLFFKLDARRMYLKIFYELDYQSALYDLINSFRKFLSDQKKQIAAYHLQANRNFINLLMRICQLPPQKRNSSSQLYTDINRQSAQQLPEKEWLLRQFKIVWTAKEMLSCNKIDMGQI